MATRIVTAVLLIPAVLAAVFYVGAGPLSLGILVLVAFLLAKFEAESLIPSRVAFESLWIDVILLFAAAPIVVNYGAKGMLVVLCVLMTVSVLYGIRALRLSLFGKFGTGLLLGPWVSAPLWSIAIFAADRHYYANEIWNFRHPLLLLLIPIWVGDTAAIFVGKAFGKTPMAPRISPKKTWEGALGNFVGCLAGAWATGAYCGIPLAPSLACGLVAGTLGQAGDLFESALKRSVGRKDSGALLPGHGGILDRIDSLLFSAIPIVLILAFWVR